MVNSKLAGPLLALKSFFCSFILFIFFFFFIALIFSFWDTFSANHAVIILLSGYYIAVFGGGFWAGEKSKSHGWLKGIIVGVIYMLVIFCWSRSFLGETFSFSQLSRLGFTILAAAAGGMLGVNLQKKY